MRARKKWPLKTVRVYLRRHFGGRSILLCTSWAEAIDDGSILSEIIRVLAAAIRKERQKDGRVRCWGYAARLGPIVRR
jgi:hypothetical protein